MISISNTLKILILSAIGLIIASCGESVKLGSYTPEELIEMAIEDYENEDYIDAKEKLKTIQLQYPSSSYADDAQYYTGMVNFAQSDYVLASYSFSRIERLYPGSEYKVKSAFMAAQSQYELSPAHYRDQDYSHQAIKAFQQFQYLYPNQDSLYGIATKRISELRNKLALKEFSVAQQYDILDAPQSSVIYYDIVLDEYPDTQYYEEAFVGKIGSLVRMRKYQEALGLIALYRQKFIAARFNDKINDLESEAEIKKLENAQAESID